MMDGVSRYLNRTYSVIPDGKTREEWEVERVSLLYSLSGHRWLYGADQRFDVIGSEIKCVVPVINPDTGKKVTKTRFVAKVDKLVRDRATRLVYVWERKSTTHAITEADYWANLAQGDQITGYLYGMRVAQVNGQLAKYGVQPSDAPIAGAFCDVWHRPDITPKMLSQGDTADFVCSGEYCGEQFNVQNYKEGQPPTVNGAAAQVVPGKKEGTFAIRETPEMFGSRLLADIAERPEHYFAQREVSRTDQELAEFQRHLFNLSRQIRYVERYGIHCRDRHSCRVPFWCEFKGLCESGVAIGPDVIPPGYQNKFAETEVQLT
jgi:hypothetical protein